MKRGLAVALILAFVIIFSFSFVSASIFSDSLSKITGKIPIKVPVCGNRILEKGELCDKAATDLINNPYGSQCSANCWVNGAPPYWSGCRGSGVHVCTDNPKVTNQYFLDHPKCIKNSACAGLFFSCNGVICPEPVAITKNVTKISITNCRNITSSGNYVLQNDLNGENTATCLNVHDASQVYIDCANKTISTNVLSVNNKAVKITNVTDFSLKNCIIKANNVPVNSVGIGLYLSNSSNGTITNNNFTSYAIVTVQ
jgi:hypothetical protein